VNRVDGPLAGDPDRVALRAWSEGDAGWYAHCAQDPEIQRFTSDPSDLTAEQVRDAIKRLTDQPERDAYLICGLGPGGERLGNLAVDYHGRTAEISYWVSPAARGRGVAAAAIQLLIDTLTAGGRVDWLSLWTHVDNVASRRVAEQCGFARIATADQIRTVKGAQWLTVQYRRSVPVCSSPTAPEPDAGEARVQ